MRIRVPSLPPKSCPCPTVHLKYFPHQKLMNSFNIETDSELGTQGFVVKVTVFQYHLCKCLGFLIFSQWQTYIIVISISILTSFLTSTTQFCLFKLCFLHDFAKSGSFPFHFPKLQLPHLAENWVMSLVYVRCGQRAG